MTAKDTEFFAPLTAAKEEEFFANLAAVILRFCGCKEVNDETHFSN